MPHSGFDFHANGKPKIRSYEDAFAYLVRDREFTISDATAIHLFHIDLREAIDSYEVTIGRPMTRIDIDNYIDRSFGATRLDDYIKNAIERYDDHKDKLIKKIRKSKFFPVSGAWAGFWGNMLTLFVGFIVTLFVAIFSTESAVTGTIDFYNKCILPIYSN